MSLLQPVIMKSDKLARCQPQELVFYYLITGAKTNASLALLSYPILLGYDSTQLTQSLVEAFLGHTSTAPCATIFDSTSMGTDMIGGVIDMAGQADKVLGYRSTVTQTAGGTPANTALLVQASQTGLTATSLTSGVAVYDGDIYFRLLAGNLDSATAGFLTLSVLFRSK